MSISHNYPRLFQIDKIKAPRDFIKPEVIVAPTYLEIGAGKGKHALQFSLTNPESKLFAIERTKEKFSAFKKKLSIARSVNLKAIHADAIPWTVFALPSKSLDGVFILYPNPEHNNPNQRWLRMPYFEFLLSRLKDNRKIVLASNIESYINEALNYASNVWSLDVEVSEVPVQSQRTHFEIKYLARGETCWQLDIKKPSAYNTRFDS